MSVTTLLTQTQHRPWPLPNAAWVMQQTWYNLLFAHWPLPVAYLRRCIPAALEIDAYAGQGWIGVVPFGMSEVYPRYTFAVPGLSRFLELNVRTYVRYGDQPGVYFFSLDAANPIAVEIARRWYRLPYYAAQMQMSEAEGWVNYASQRAQRGAPLVQFVGRYRPVGEIYTTQSGTLEHWLTERYCLYTTVGERVYRGEIHHLPWPLQRAEAEIEINTMTLPHGLALPPTSPLLHFARRIETVEWAIQRV